MRLCVAGVWLRTFDRFLFGIRFCLLFSGRGHYDPGNLVYGEKIMGIILSTAEYILLAQWDKE